tara:strand:+ start:18428 stop:21322 length:2895 start_codon:yes stop_codon:yes gene_type:complete
MQYNQSESWYLTYDESFLLKNKSFPHKLAMAVQLKQYQSNGFFPKVSSEISNGLVSHLSNQLETSASTLKGYDWSSRTARNHREEILKFLGFEKTNENHRKELIEFLIDDILPYGSTKTEIEEICLKWFLEHRLAVPTEKVLSRTISTTLAKFENRLFTQVASLLGRVTTKLFDRCLKNDSREKGSFTWLRSDSGRASLATILNELDKLAFIEDCVLPLKEIGGIHPKIRERLYKRIASESAWEVRRHPPYIRDTLMCIFLHARRQKIIDDLVDLFILLVGKLSKKAKKKVETVLVKEMKRVYGKTTLLARIAKASLKDPKGTINKVIFPIANKAKLSDIVKEYKYSGKGFKNEIHNLVRSSYSSHYRRMVPQILGSLTFRSNNDSHTPILDAIDWLLENPMPDPKFSMANGSVPTADIIRPSFIKLVKGMGKGDMDRIDYEIAVLEALRKRLRCKEIWVEGADKYRNPDEDVPMDFNMNRKFYYDRLGVENDPLEFTRGLREEMETALKMLNENLPSNKYVRLRQTGVKNIVLSPSDPLMDPPNISALKGEVQSKWPMTSLLDILREADSWSSFTKSFKSVRTSERLSPEQLRKRLLLALYGLGTNMGLNRLASGNQVSYKELRHVKNAYIHKDSLRRAIREVANGTFSVKDAKLWGEATTSCASDSKKFGSWDQNLMTEWHIRYGGKGVMIYWHVDTRSTCIYSQLKKCSSSEVANMIEGVLKHCTDMKVEKQFVDTHGQSEVAFAFCRLLGFELMPRLKNIASQKLYLPDISLKKELKNLLPILKRSIKWEIIERQYDEMVKYTAALEQGTADPESILKRFTRGNESHPTYRALQELGKAVKTIFLCRYLADENVRREIHGGLNVIENWNSANGFIFFGKSGEVSSNRLEEQELSVLALHLLQNCLVYVNTLMIQRVVAENGWMDRFDKEDYRALSPLIHAHVNPYGKFELDMDKNLGLAV